MANNNILFCLIYIKYFISAKHGLHTNSRQEG